MDFEEFQESDVIFSSDYSWDQINSSENGGNGIHRHRHGQWKSLSLPRNDNKKEEKQQRMISSSPMSVPVNIPAVGMGFCRYDIDVAAREPFDQTSDEDQDDDLDEDDIMGRLPPHLIVERRLSGEIARSFSPLKGRNLCQLRNSVLRMTGFLER